MVGHARVSSIGQWLDVQVAKLHHCDKLFEEHAAGAPRHAPDLVVLSGLCTKGDTSVVTC